MGSMNLQPAYTAAPAIGYAGQMEAGDQPRVTAPIKNADAVSIAFGTMVAFKTSSPTSDLDVIVPAGSTSKYHSIVAWDENLQRAYTVAGSTFGDLDATGVRVGTIFTGLRAGMILVPCVTGCAIGDPLFVCHTTGGATYTGTVGTMGNAAEAGKTSDLTNRGTWRSKAAAGALAWLEVDLRNQ